jgi:hypothetical protein
LHAKELQEMQERKVVEEKMKRIQAGLEDNYAVIESSEGNVQILEETIFNDKNEPIIITFSAETFNS